MTNKLLGLYLRCFKDDYINVRELACKVAQNLYEKSSRVIDALIFTSRFDKVTKIKALAIRSNFLDLKKILDLNSDNYFRFILSFLKSLGLDC